MPIIRIALALLVSSAHLFGQSYGQPDRERPGDLMIQRYLQRAATQIEADFLKGTTTQEQWNQARSSYRTEFLDMLGLWPLPDKTPLHATITRTLDRGEYQVDMIHYQSRPGLYVTGNLFRPATLQPGQRLPAIFYVCGHSGRGRNGNKTAFQSHGIWLARHGYICLVVDTLQLGEIAGVHHGTYREGRWWWLSRGYTPAGVECWNGVRGIDYLVSRPDVDPARIGVTGISGGGAATFWIAAADERVKVAVPVSGMADLVSYVPNRVINGHCDCMFLYNTYQWPWTRIAALIAPRPLLFVNSDQDSIFPMDANERVINRLERLYSLFGAGDLVDGFVSVGGHAYRTDIRQATFRFLNTHLQSDPRPVRDSEVDLVTGPREEIHPIAPETLRVFPQDSDLPKDAINREVDREFVPLAQVTLPTKASFGEWRADLLANLRKRTFHHFPETIPPAQPAASTGSTVTTLQTEPGIEIGLNQLRSPSGATERIVLWVTGAHANAAVPDWLNQRVQAGDALYVCQPRGIGLSSWTESNPPNYVERSHCLLGRTVDSGRVWDIAATAGYLRKLHGTSVSVVVAGEGASAALAIYAALLEPGIESLILREVPSSHMSPEAPALLNVLRVCDVPEALGMVAPRAVTLLGDNVSWAQKSAAIYEAAGASGRLTVATQ